MKSFKDLPDLDFPVKSMPLTAEDLVLLRARIAADKKKNVAAGKRRAKRAAMLLNAK